MGWGKALLVLSCPTESSHLPNWHKWCMLRYKNCPIGGNRTKSWNSGTGSLKKMLTGSFILSLCSLCIVWDYTMGYMWFGVHSLIFLCKSLTGEIVHITDTTWGQGTRTVLIQSNHTTYHWRQGHGISVYPRQSKVGNFHLTCSWYQDVLWL